MRIEKLITTYNVNAQWIHFPLHPDTPAQGLALADLFGAGPDVIQQKNQDMKQRMAAEGLPYGDRTHTYNSRLAQELGKWADTQPGGAAIHDALFKAYFVDARNVHDLDVLLDVTASVGLPVDEARKVLEERRFEKAVDDDWAKSRLYGVTGVPTFVAGRKGVVGAQPYEVIEHLLVEAGAQASS